MARGDVRIAVTLACEDCKRRNYQTNKSRRNTPDRIELSKYCKWCGKHTAHKETRCPLRAKIAARRKAEAAKRRQQADQGIEQERDAESTAAHDTQVPESADVLE